MLIYLIKHNYRLIEKNLKCLMTTKQNAFTKEINEICSGLEF